MIKAKYVADDLHKIVLADDSGIEIDAFGKLPGIYSARFLGKDTPYPIINQAIIDAIEGKERTCRFVCALALCIPDQEHLKVKFMTILPGSMVLAMIQFSISHLVKKQVQR